MPPSSPPAGRTYRPPTSPLSRAAVLPDQRHRLAWLLGTWRMLGTGGRHTDPQAFADRLVETGMPGDEPHVTRWESGSLAAPTHVVAGYERVLGLTPYRLRGAVDVIAPGGTAMHGLELEAPGSTERLDDVLALAFAGEPTGLQWLEAAQRMNAIPSVHLRTTDWSALASRLLSEQVTAVDVEYAARTVTIGLMLHIPTARSHVVRSIGSQVLTGPGDRRADAVRLLSLVPGPQTAGLVLRLLDSDDPDVRTGAAHTLATMLADRTFEPGLLRVAQHRLIAGLRQDPTDLDLVDAALRLPDQLRVDVIERTRNSDLARLTATYETCPSVVAAATARRLADAIRTQAARRGVTPSGGPDVTLPTLCREALFHSHHRRRTAAQALLLASPYEPVLRGVAQSVLGKDPGVGRRLTLVPAWADVSRSGL